MALLLEPVIGLEIHVQLKTKSKMFCSCPVHDAGVSANTNVCPVCLGQPGALPVPNRQAVEWTVLTGLALGCAIASRSKFDRKHYFYPDLPKAYQISQYDLPIAEHGKLRIVIPAGEHRKEAEIGITRIHLEEDAAKNVHGGEGDDGRTFVDFNRAGTPLMEIVTEPDFRTPEEAKVFLTELRLIARYLGVSDADMEKGHLRCDANVSLRERDEEGNIIGMEFNPKTEVKNLNSFRNVERAIAHEIARQTALWEAGSPPAESTTRGWNDAKQKTEDQRSKEEAADYRYFPEPDIPAMELSALAEELRPRVPELPAARRQRFMEEYALKPADARIICDDPALANFAERAFSELHAWLNALPELDGQEEKIWEEQRGRIGKLVSGWLISKLGGLLAERSIDIRTMKITPENFAEFVTLIASGKLSSKSGLTVLGKMLDDGDDPSHIMEELKLGKMDDAGAIAEAVDSVIAANPDEVRRYLAGEEKLIKFFIGKIMKETEGTADPKIAENVLKVKLEGPTE